MNEILTGKTQTHLTPAFGGFLFDPAAADALRILSKRASENGFELKVLSSFRDYDKQKNIWNAKASGKRVLLDSQGHPLNFHELSKEQVVEAIMRWSAFPGASRHHWGTDLDVYDARAVASDYKVELTPQEVSGVFYPFYAWLDELIARDDAEGFFRPYDQDRGGVAPEAWHLSYRPSAKKYEEAYTLEFFKQHLLNCHDVDLCDIVLSKADEIYDRFIARAFST